MQYHWTTEFEQTGLKGSKGGGGVMGGCLGWLDRIRRTSGCAQANKLHPFSSPGHLTANSAGGTSTVPVPVLRLPPSVPVGRRAASGNGNDLHCAHTGSLTAVTSTAHRLRVFNDWAK